MVIFEKCTLLLGCQLIWNKSVKTINPTEKLSTYRDNVYTHAHTTGQTTKKIK